MNTNVSQEQINALKCLIINLDGDNEVKKVIFALIDASECLTKPVAYTTTSPELINKISLFINSGEGIRLKGLMKLLGANFNPDSNHQSTKNFAITADSAWRFSKHDGCLSNGKFIVEMLPGCDDTRTFWLSFHSYDPDAAQISEAQVNQMGLPILVT
ncbi:MAG: hypothetical protein WCT50_02290 [Patescibacteria group bacterium]|jgi:hypothetical protein